MKKWYERAKPLLRENKITHRQVAKRLGCTPGSVTHKLNGRRDATIEEIQVIADMIGVSIITFLEDDPETAYSEEEKQLLRQFRELDKTRRMMSLKMVYAIAE